MILSQSGACRTAQLVQPGQLHVCLLIWCESCMGSTALVQQGGGASNSVWLLCDCPQADTLGVPMVDEDRSHFLALVNARIGVSWDGRRVVAPPGVVDEAGTCDLEPYMPANFSKTRNKKQQ